jgi:hypothetical protein
MSIFFWGGRELSNATEIIGTATPRYTSRTSITGRCISPPLKNGSAIESGYIN